MHFCAKCQNMYYIRINAENTNKLVYYCRKCGNEDDELIVDTTCVSKTNLKQSSVASFGHVINKYTKLDPTLPRVTNVACPNQECKRTTKEIICVRYDDVNLKYVYLCTDCDEAWN